MYALSNRISYIGRILLELLLPLLEYPVELNMFKPTEFPFEKKKKKKKTEI